jgi:hypothetical protein
MTGKCPRTGKVQHPTEQAARAAMTAFVAYKDAAGTLLRGLRVYRCDPRIGGCGCWHFGHPKQQTKRRRSAVRGR